MIYSRNELLSIFPSQYQINKALEKKQFFKVENNIYSTDEFSNPLEVISKKYPFAIFTDESAYSFWNLTDYIPDNYYLATKRNQTRIKSDSYDIKQVFELDKFYSLGKTTKEVNGAIINIYDRERLLIDLVRSKNKFPFDIYIDIIHNYRLIKDDLDFYKLTDYLHSYKNGDDLLNRIQCEVL